MHQLWDWKLGDFKLSFLQAQSLQSICAQDVFFAFGYEETKVAAKSK